VLGATVGWIVETDQAMRRNQPAAS
jgi:hypothetical protein